MSKPMKKANELPQFTGPFQELIPKYISYKRAQGYKIGNPIVYRLREMDLFFKDRGIMDIQITREMYEKWTSQVARDKRFASVTELMPLLLKLRYSGQKISPEDMRHVVDILSSMRSHCLSPLRRKERWLFYLKKL